MDTMGAMNTSERVQFVNEMLSRRTQAVFPDKDSVAARLAGEEKLTVYLGIDPTGVDIHLGHTIPLLLLKDLAKLGHDTVLLVGDFTARIGDPTGKSAARVSLSGEDIERNMAGYVEQVEKIAPGKAFRIAYNSEWLAALSMEQIIKLSSMVTVQQMIQRDMFQERIKAEKPVYLNEFLYPLIQGYDSVALRTDGEVGGNDQTFNMLMGRELSKEIIGKDKFVLVNPLLVDSATGKKMSKSEGSLIALSDSPQEIRRKVLALDDSMTHTVFTLCTERPLEWIDGQEKTLDARGFKELLATELVSMFHGQEAVVTAGKATEISATGPLDKVLKESGIVSSLSEAKRLVTQKGVLLNSQTAERWDVVVEKGDEIQVGKGKKMKVV